MPISAAAKANFETLLEAFRCDDVCLAECTRKRDGATVNMICAVAWDGEAYALTPFAEMVDGNPFELYDPPEVGDDEAISQQGDGHRG